MDWGSKIGHGFWSDEEHDLIRLNFEVGPPSWLEWKSKAQETSFKIDGIMALMMFDNGGDE